jgi:uncharacterized protein YbjT (DUF2867 family)
MLVIVGASGKLGFATLNALLNHRLLPHEEFAGEGITVTTSSESGAQKLSNAKEQGVTVKTTLNWDSPSSDWEPALQGADKLFLISSARIEKDFFEAPPGKGREEDHFKALEAAKKVGVKHVYYSSLAFATPSKSRVMKAHERTEEWLRNSGMRFTIIREGLYNESWPLYFGHYKVPPEEDERSEVLVAGDSKISWTSIQDLGLTTAVVLAASSDEWAGKTFYLAHEKAHTLAKVAEMVSKAKGREVKLKVVSREEHERYYIQERGMGGAMVKWWSKTYDALRENECEIHDPTLDTLMAKRGFMPKAMDETVAEMLKAQ